MMTLVCLTTIIVNLSKESFNSEDEVSLARAIEQCKLVYDDAPCLVKFIKTETNTYQALCGKPK